MIRISLIVVTIFQTSVVESYKTPTHDRISLEIVEKSDVNTEGLLSSLGLAGLRIDDGAFPSYVPRDPVNPTPAERIFKPRATIEEIIRAGSVFEDEGLNVVNHFLDPQHGAAGASIEHPDIALSSEYSSLEWAVENEDIPNQDYSYNDALDYFYQALTEPLEEDRDVAWGKMFRSLGHVIHHLQDMAQPQHVRNDIHCDAFATRFLSKFCLPINNPSFFEKYTNGIRNDLPFNDPNVPIPVFSRVSEFWINGQGTGLAQFTSLNFVSDGTNFALDRIGNPLAGSEYPLPESGGFSFNTPTLGNLLLAGLSPGDREAETAVLDKLDSLGCEALSDTDCPLTFIQTTVNDPGLAFSKLNERASSLSMFDKELTSRNRKVSYPVNGNTVIEHERIPILNQFNFEAAYPYLIPRAVAYGAGLINHFFRGRLHVERAVFGNNGTQVRLDIKNVSGNSSALSDGVFELFYDNPNSGAREPWPFSSEILSGLGSDETASLEFTPPRGIQINSEKIFQVVFKGKVGEETAVATSSFGLTFVDPEIPPVLEYAKDSTSSFAACNFDYRVISGEKISFGGSNYDDADAYIVSRGGFEKEYEPNADDSLTIPPGDFQPGELEIKVRSKNGLESNTVSTTLVHNPEIIGFPELVQNGMKVVVEGNNFGNELGSIGEFTIDLWTDDSIEFIYDETQRGHPEFENLTRPDCITRKLILETISSETGIMAAGPVQFGNKRLFICKDRSTVETINYQYVGYIPSDLFVAKGFIYGQDSRASVYFDDEDEQCGLEEGNLMPFMTSSYIRNARSHINLRPTGYWMYFSEADFPGWSNFEPGNVLIYDPETLLPPE